VIHSLKSGSLATLKIITKSVQRQSFLRNYGTIANNKFSKNEHNRITILSGDRDEDYTNTRMS
jgi:hypothetical protein